MNNPYLAQIEEALPSYLPDDGGAHSSVIRSMQYSLMAGGKRIRPTLLLAFCSALGGDSAAAMPYACAVEMVHTYSLIHDDLPCMDDDDLRRGRPSNHVAFGEDIALLAGDALQSLAFEIMLSKPALEKNGLCGAKAAHTLAEAIGADGMVGGQVIDLETEGKDPDLDEISLMYAKKTGALLRAACVMGAELAGADEAEISACAAYAEKIGLAFQIVDDILDIESDTQTLGKPVGSDKENEKVNYVTKVGIDVSKQLVDKLTSEAVEALGGIPSDTTFLKELALSLAHRVR